MGITVQTMGPRTEKAAQLLATPEANHHLPRFKYPKTEIPLKSRPKDENHYVIDLGSIRPTKRVDRRRVRIKLARVFGDSRLDAGEQKESMLRMTVEPMERRSDVLKFVPNLDDQGAEEL